ncbi:MAG: hypothetical protein Q8Q18_01875 [bacterium]|nr:hypothetical protein [bacterium]
MGVKSFLMKQALKRQLKDLPEAQREVIMKAIEENPELFEKIGNEIKRSTDKGVDQTIAAMDAMKKYQKELQQVLGGLQK